MKRTALVIVALVASSHIAYGGLVRGPAIHGHHHVPGGGVTFTEPQPRPPFPWNAPTRLPPWERGCTVFDDHGNWRDVC
jgi:hypothetical protein